ADQGIQEMRQNVDTLLVIPNQRLLEIIDHDTTADAAFKLADDVLLRSIRSISDVLTSSGQINMDLNDLRAIMKDAGDALIGMGEASGLGRALKAAKAAVQSPLLENVVMDGAKGLIINITGSKAGAASLKLSEIEEATAYITGAASPDAKTKPGYAYDDALADAIRITVIATGFPARRRSLARLGHRAGSALAPRAPRHPLDAEPARGAASPPEDWSKPAFMRLKVRRLK
ncbi:MAG: cell division protein FtsZ, partial [Elusimicrobia bacterium]|nr:cell division protein FtsZ [Elusimicrobiota bacterium]